jgi:hypothetical protein
MERKKILAFISLVIILTFIGYIIYDTAKGEKKLIESLPNRKDMGLVDQWKISQVIEEQKGLKAVTVASDGRIFTGGESLIVSYDSKLNKLWQFETSGRINALSINGDTIYAASEETIYLISPSGKVINEWGPYEAKSLITSLSANKDYLAVADAANKIVFIIEKDGEVHSMIGQADEKLLIPSLYFDVCLTGDNMLFLAHTGKHRIEKWTTDGEFISSFGEPGSDPGKFCGCCNPAHFTGISGGFITSEKGINRIKLLDSAGKFVEYVSSVNGFIASAPLDVSSADGKTIYGANPADSKLYVFRRK